MSIFIEAKKALLRRKDIFIDYNFPANRRSIGKLSVAGEIVWKRPQQLCENPKFIVDGVSRLDVVQGQLGDCWFISAADILAQQQQDLFEWCIPPGQSFIDEYAGIFLFRFWEFGSWREIYIDDQLPTVNGELCFGHNRREPDEFWVPLFEKAYAKFKGCYKDLVGGYPSDALVDFTGGIGERVLIEPYRLMGERLFETMMHMQKMSSMMACWLNKPSSEKEFRNRITGLVARHTYSISDIRIVTTILGAQVKLLRIRNPWAKTEWKRDWADQSKKWDKLSDSLKKEMGVVKMNEGEFWMSYDDWLNHFEILTICHLDPRAMNTPHEQEKNKVKTDWEVISRYAEWIVGYNAGGAPYSYNDWGSRDDDFFTNPQYKLTILDKFPTKTTTSLSPSSPPPIISPPEPTISSLHSFSSYSTQPTPPTPHHYTTVIISLMQFSRSWNEQIPISYSIYKVKKGVGYAESDRNFKKNDLKFHMSFRILQLRELTYRFDLDPGNYVVIPYTAQKNQAASFLLRIFTEVPVQEDKGFNTHTAIWPTKDPYFLEEEKSEKVAIYLFKTFTPSSSRMDATELLKALDHNAKEGGWPGFTSLEAARCMVSIFGVAERGFVTEQELQHILKELQNWTEHFKAFDSDKSGAIDCKELASMYSSIGIETSYKLVKAIVGKYAGRKEEVALDEFALCSCKIKHTYDLFKKLSANGKLHMDLEEWMSLALTL